MIAILQQLTISVLNVSLWRINELLTSIICCIKSKNAKELIFSINTAYPQMLMVTK